MSELLIRSNTAVPLSTSTEPIFSSRVWSKTWTLQPCWATSFGTVNVIGESGETSMTGGVAS